MTDAAGVPAAMPQSDSVRQFAAILYRRRAIVVVAFLVTSLVATVLALLRPPVYEAASTLLADKTPPFVLLANSQSQSSLVQQPLAQAPDVFTLTEVAKSDAVREAAAARLTSTLDRTRANMLLGGVRVQPVKSTDLVRVSVRDRDPSMAAAVATAVAEAVVTMDLNARRRQATIAREFIGEQVGAAGRELRARQHALATFKKENHDVSLSDQTQLSLRNLADLGAELTDVRLQQQQVQAGFVRPVSAGRAATHEVGDPVITLLQSQLAALEVEYSGLRKQFTSVHPQVISTQAKIEETQKRLGIEVDRRRTALDTRERNLTAEIARIEQGLTQVPSREANVARLTIDSREAERTYLLLSEKFQEARIAEASIGSAVRIIDVANPSGTPVRSQSRAVIFLGAFLGLLLGVGGAYVTEQLDDSVRSAREVAQILGVPILGCSPLLPASSIVPRGGADGGHAPFVLGQLDQSSIVVAEAFHLLRTHVLQAMSRAQSKCIVITSARPREGKTTVAANLAISVAQTDRCVWLVDCNLRQPSLGRLFPEAHSPGLTALLAGHVAGVEDVVRRTTHPRLQCIMSGSAVEDPSSLLDTQMMTRFLDQARERADAVFLDCAAVDGLTDAEVIGVRSDAVIFVAETGRTSRFALAQARQRFEALGVHVLGAIVNQPADGRFLYSPLSGGSPLRQAYTMLQTRFATFRMF